ncbi:hypothetical protein V6N12_017549 [Hibiscus sabdariffa]|uniref:Pentatricopeptide repeat-containing protein n=1 Tax=Hibiscus sabdariffa TaxID=183260 RepID=A0ABR2CFV5_9ROSI
MYAKCGLPDNGHLIFDFIKWKIWVPLKHLFAWAALIHGLVQCGNAVDAFDLFVEMRRNIISIINSLILSSIVGASANLEMLELGKQVHGLVIRLGMLHVEASGEKVKASWDTRTTMIFCDLCIKEILDGNRPGWNYTKRTIDASEEWWKSRLQVVPEAQRFRTVSIDPEVEEKLDQMFRGILATGDKAWAPSLGILLSDFFEHDDNEALDEIEEENAIGSDGNNESPEIQSEPIEQMQQKQKSTDAGSSHFKRGKRKSLKQVGGAAKLTPAMDPFGIQHAIKILDGLSEEVPKASELYFFALNLMVNKEKRTVFLSIDPEIRIWWLKREMEESSKLSSLLRP